MAKHYIRLNENDEIIKGFTTDFEEPLETDICINENGGRHFELLGEINPRLTNYDFVNDVVIPIYKFVDDNVENIDSYEKVVE